MSCYNEGSNLLIFSHAIRFDRNLGQLLVTLFTNFDIYEEALGAIFDYARGCSTHPWLPPTPQSSLARVRAKNSPK